MQNEGWIPRGIFLFGSIALGVLLILNKSLYKIPYLDWGLAAFIFMILVLYFAARGRIKAQEFQVFVIPLLWMAYALLMTYFAVDWKHHVLYILLVAGLSLLASALIIAVFTDYRRGIAISWIYSLWVLINFSLLILWVFNRIEYPRDSFSGLFGNRNNFSVQTVILISLTYFFVKKSLWKTITIILGVILILASQSITGFISLVFILAYPIYVTGNRRRRLIIIILSIALIILTYLLIGNLAARIDRFLLFSSDPQMLRENESVFLRSWAYTEGFKVFLHNPISGIGVDNARYVLIPPEGKLLDGTGMMSHSNYIEMFLNAGLPGFILHYGLLLYILLKVTVQHPLVTQIKTLIVFYFFISFTAVTYNQFSGVFLFNLPIFLYLFHSNIERKS